VAVRDALLALLTPGPAYGFQLHNELESRTGGVRSINVGQTYSTLDRLTRQGLIEPAGATDDGLPLHRLTGDGRAAAERWLDGADTDWEETLDRVLVGASLGRDDVDRIIERSRDAWAAVARRRRPASPDLAGVARAAEIGRARSVVAWLDDLRAQLARDPDALAVERSPERPRRGRRPAA
jgi:DNA-binding PadR family transcriptional regulator